MTLRAVKVIEKAGVIFCSKSWAEKLAEYVEGKKLYHGYWRLFPVYLIYVGDFLNHRYKSRKR